MENSTDKGNEKPALTVGPSRWSPFLGLTMALGMGYHNFTNTLPRLPRPKVKRWDGAHQGAKEKARRLRQMERARRAS